MTVIIIHSPHAYIYIPEIFHHMTTYTHFPQTSASFRAKNDWFDAKLSSASFYLYYSFLNYTTVFKFCSVLQRYLYIVLQHSHNRNRVFSFLIHFTISIGNKRVSFSQLKSPQWEISGTKRLRSEVSTNLVYLLQDIQKLTFFHNSVRWYFIGSDIDPC